MACRLCSRSSAAAAYTKAAAAADGHIFFSSTALHASILRVKRSEFVKKTQLLLLLLI